MGGCLLALECDLDSVDAIQRGLHAHCSGLLFFVGSDPVTWDAHPNAACYQILGELPVIMPVVWLEMTLSVERGFEVAQ
eukprot:120800-Rhodomonas_salina.1